MTTFVSPQAAVQLIGDGMTLGIGGFAGYGTAESLLRALRSRYDAAGSPKNLTMVKVAGVGDRKTRGVNRIAVDGLITRLITSYMAQEPLMLRLVQENKAAAYMLPLGTLNKLYRAIAAGQPGVWTDVGLHTFVDPRLGGGLVNDAARREGRSLSRVVSVDGREYLFYPSFPIHACFIRGSYADEDGNVTLCQEGMVCEQQELAEAVHSSGGIVIVQVGDIVQRHSLDPRQVQLHHFLVDYVVKAPADMQPQSFEHEGFWPEITGDIRLPVHSLAPMPLNERKICCRRAALELRPGSFINLGIGMPESVGSVAAEEGLDRTLTLTTESGVIGGVPLSGLDMGANVNPEAIYRMSDIMDIYDGGGLDLAILGLAEMDRHGNSNVACFNGHLTGPGGFIDITQNTQHVVFMGTFTAGGLKEECVHGKLRILQEGKYKKFKNEVEQITFSGPFSAQRKQDVLIITERAVFRLTQDGLALTEIAPGIELEKDILGQMEFRPVIAENLTLMDSRIFRDSPMGLVH